MKAKTISPLISVEDAKLKLHKKIRTSVLFSCVEWEIIVIFVA